MAIKVKAYAATITAGAIDVVIESLTVPKGEKWTLVSTGYYLGQTGEIKCYLRGELFDRVVNNLAPDDDHPVPRNIEMVEGTTYKITASNSSASDATFGALLVLDVVRV